MDNPPNVAPIQIDTGEDPANDVPDPKRKEPCRQAYDLHAANCGSHYYGADDGPYNACMERAWGNYIRCLNGSGPIG